MKKLLTLCAAVLTSVGMWAAEVVDCSGASATSSTGNTNKSTSTNYAVYFTRGGGGWGVNSSKGYQGKTDAIAVFKLIEATDVKVIISNNGNSARTFTVTAKPFKTIATGDEFLSILEVSNAGSYKYADCVSASKNYAKIATTSPYYNSAPSTFCTLSNTELSGTLSYTTGEQTLAASAISVEYGLDATLPAGVYAVGFSAVSNSSVSLAGFKFTAASKTVKYYNNGGSGSIADGTGSSITLSDGTGFTAPSGYSFAGWNTAIDGSGTAYAAGATVTVSLELYAQWTQAITLDANLANHGTGNNGSATALYNGTELGNIVHTTPATGYTLKGYYTAATEGVKVLNANGSFAANAITGYVVEGAWKKTGTTTLYAQYAEPEKYSVTHTLTNVTATSGATGENAATQGTAYVAVFAANAEYSLPASVTVTIGGDAQTEGEGYTYSAGTVTIPGAYVAGDIVITVAGDHNVCATPTITASTTFNFTNKGYAVTITNNEAGSTLKYSTDGTNWSDYTATLYATTTTTFYAKSVKSNYADSEVASKEVTNSFDTEKKYIAWVYTAGYGSASYAFATDPMVIGLQADYNVVDVALTASTNPTSATDIAEADLIVCTEAMQGNNTLSNNMKNYAGSTPMIGLKAYNYSSGRWSWGTPANPSSTTTSFKPKASNYKVLNGVTFESDGSIKLATASSGNVIQTVQFGTDGCTAPTGNVIMGNIDDVDTKAVMYASTKYFGLGLSSDCWATYTDNAVTIVKNAAAMLIAGEALDVLVYAVTYSAGDGSVKEGEALPTQAATVAGGKFNLASGDALEKSGYIFDGWLCNVDAVKYAAGDEYTMTAAATTFTAQWKDKPAAPISWTSATASIALNGDAATLQTLTNEETLTVAYSSDDTDVASINAETGVITLNAVGTANITATYTSTAEGAYKTTAVTYELTVTAATYAVTFDTPSNGTLVVKKQVEEEWVAITSGDKFVAGTTLKVEATPVKDYVLYSLTANGNDIKESKEFTIGTADVAVEATFAYSPSGIDNTEAGVNAVKTLKNGVLIIEKNGVRYNMLGERVQ